MDLGTAEIINRLASAYEDIADSRRPENDTEKAFDTTLVKILKEIQRLLE